MTARCTLALVVALAGCDPSPARPDASDPGMDSGAPDQDAGGRDSGAPDRDAGGGPELDCAGMAAGASSSPRVMIEGVVGREGGDPEENVLVQVFDGADVTLSTPLDMGTTLAAGAFDLALDLPRMEARAVGLRADPPTGALRRTYVFFPRGVNADVTLAVPLYDDPAWNGLYMAAAATPNPMRGLLLVRVFDCASAALAGATVALDRTQPDTSIVYLEGGAPSGRASTDAEGRAAVLNAPTGDVTLTVSARGGALELGQGTFNVRPDRVTMAIWR